MKPLDYPRWIWANAWSELAGLGGTMTLGYVIFSRLDDAAIGVVLAGAAFAVIAGAALEGGLVGFAQARVLRRSRSAFPTGAWIRATTVGAGVAWFLGMMPTTMMSLASDPASASEAGEGPEGIAIIALAAGMGLVLGPVLSTPQYFVLRRNVFRAGTWIGANAFAWSVGMVVVFVGAGTLSMDSSVAQVVTSMAIACIAAGAAVGAIHGLFLRRMLSAGPKP